MFRRDTAEGGVDAFKHIKKLIRRGDLIGARGSPGRSKMGELSLFASHMELLAPCLHMLPKSFQGLSDVETRFRQRYLDLILNSGARQVHHPTAASLNDPLAGWLAHPTRCSCLPGV